MNMDKLAARTGVILGIVLFLFGLSLAFHVPAAQRLWLWPGTPAEGFSFVGAWIAGGVAPLVWSGLFRQLAPLRALASSGLIAAGGTAWLLYSKHDLAGNERYFAFFIIFAIAFLVSVYVWIRSGRNKAPKGEVSPVIRWVFLAFSLLLLFFGAGMVLLKPNLFPLALSPDMQSVYGWFFLGSCAYFFYGFLRPSRSNAIGPMISFLVYDLLLIPPFLRYAPAVPAELRTSLTLYLGVLLVSALFCLYYLLADRKTRLLGNFR